MQLEEIKRFYEARPFRPFELILDDGRILPVEDWIYISFPPDGKRVHVAVGQDGWAFVEISAIVRLQLLGKRQNLNSNSRKKAA